MALRAQLAEAQREVQEWVEETQRRQSEVVSLTAALRQIGPRREPAAAVGADAPELACDDSGPLLDFLEHCTKGHLRFTAGVDRIWRKLGYRHPVQSEVRLHHARAGVPRVADSQGRITARLTDWFREGFGLDVATTDQAPTRSGLASFEFEGQRLDGVPHVKLGDAKRPNECGRIYFAHQSDPARCVVHHVGLHVL